MGKSLIRSLAMQNGPNPDHRYALLERVSSPAAMKRIDGPWRYAGNGQIVDAAGLPVAFISNFHEAQIQLIVVAPDLLAAARDVLRLVAESDGDDAAWEALKTAIARAEASE